MNWKINRSINYWLWTKEWATRKQYPSSIQRFKIPHTKRNYFLLGFAFGLVPYITHMQGWLK